MASQATPQRRIRAQYTSTTITVYQAYNTDIARAATQHQKLNASPHFSTTRMTWIKPSWAWMLYRSGYSYKDPGQECILALTLTRPAFLSLLRKAVVSSHNNQAADSGVKAKNEGRSKPANVRVQWDPERTVRLEKLDYRSIQIGVPGALVEELVDGIVDIEDVTSRARELKRVLDERGDVGLAELEAMGLVPEEKAFEVDEELRKILCMDESVAV
jgi:hypothetical protein